MRASFRRTGQAALIGTMVGLAVPALAQDADSASILIYDASGSMWGQLEGGVTKVEIARDVIGEFFQTRDSTEPLGVIAYGHNRRGDCADIEVISPVGINDPVRLSSDLNTLNPTGMTPITDSLSLAASLIPPTAESADIILVTDGLETCDADPCALAAELAEQGIDIRAHVVGFGLTEQEAAVMACVADATGGLLLTPQTGQELADALDQIAQIEPSPAPEPEPVAEAFFDIGPSAEAGFTYTISYQGSVPLTSYAGFTLRGAGVPTVSPSYGVIGGAGTFSNNPFTKRAPLEAGAYDLIMVTPAGEIIARQPIEVVPASNGFDPIGSVEPDARFVFTWRGPNQVGQRIVIARSGAESGDYFESWGYPFSNRTTQTMGLRAPVEPGIYELRYLSGSGGEILFFREFGVGVPHEDADLAGSADLAEEAATLIGGGQSEGAGAPVPARFSIPSGFPGALLTWEAVPLDPGMSPNAVAPNAASFVWEGAFEPGRYRVTALAPGETTFSAEVDIRAGEANEFVLPLTSPSQEDPGSALTISGDWRLLAVAPPDAPAGTPTEPMVMAQVALMMNMQGTAYQGLFSPTEMMAGPDGAGRAVALESVTEEEGTIILRFALLSVSPEPFTVTLTSFGNGYAGSMDSPPNSLPVIFWPTTDAYPSIAEMQEALYGPSAEDTTTSAAGRSAVSVSVSQGPVIAGSGGYFPIELTAPAGFDGTIALHAANNPAAPALFSADAAEMLDAQDQVLPVPDKPGRYDVRVLDASGALVGGTQFEATVMEAETAEGGGPAAAPAGDIACSDSPAGCAITHEQSGIAVTLPNGWTMTEPFYYETAGGAVASVPSASFVGEDFGEAIRVELNPRQWLASNGPCQAIAAGQLCMFSGQGMAADIGFDLIARTLSVATPGDAQAPLASLAPSAIIPVDLGGRDPQDVLLALFPTMIEE